MQSKRYVLKDPPRWGGLPHEFDFFRGEPVRLVDQIEDAVL